MPKHSSLDQLLPFIKFTHDFQQVIRVVHIPSEDRYENDAEHSYQLAMVAWYFIEQQKLVLDPVKVISYALVHDLVEVYAGDTYFIHNQAEEKKEREAKAAKRIQAEFPDFKTIHILIHEYEARETAEARFVYALDKVLPILNIYMDNGRTWHETGMLLDVLKEAKTAKVAISPEVMPLYEELMQVLKQQPKLFPN